MSLGKYKLYRRAANLKTYLQPNYHNSTKVHWFNSPNFGDALNPILLKHIGVDSVCHINTEFYQKENLSCIGSILHVCNSHSIVWGSGFIDSKSILHYGKPKKVNAVRGPKTQKKLLDFEVECPSVYGDPALLLNIYHNDFVEKKYKIGIIPHYIDNNHTWIDQFKNDSQIKIINVLNKQALEVVDQIRSCDFIVSSSLHGLIIADTYNIPSVWIKLSEKIGGDDFKFYDYAEGVNRDIMAPIYIKDKSLSLDFLTKSKEISNAKINFDSNKLLKSFPTTFINNGK